MKYRVHFTRNNTVDMSDEYFDVEAFTIDEIRKKAIIEVNKRKLNADNNDMWSEKISE